MIELITGIIALLLLIIPAILAYLKEKKELELKIEADRVAALAAQQKQDVYRESEISDLNRKIHDSEIAPDA